MDPHTFLNNKKIVIMGLGLYGGGVASAKFCIAHGAHVTVTDLQSEETLSPSLRLFSKEESSVVTFVLGQHRETDFEQADIVIVNPAVPRENKFLKIAKESGAQLENDASLFMRFSTTTTIGVTGTRGKTTTTNWVAQLLSQVLRTQIEPIGNSSNNPLLTQLETEKETPVHIAELSSWQLELLPQSSTAPHISIITNIYPDHLNRYDNIEHYAEAKTLIFTKQNKNDFLILNYDNEWRKFILGKKPHSHTFFFSKEALPEEVSGICIKNEAVIIQENGEEKILFIIENFEKKWGSHNLENLLAALLAIHLFDPTITITPAHIQKLTEIPFRQQTIYEKDSLQIINDTTATSPDGLIAAIKRFNSPQTTFIAGGTRKDTAFDDVAKYLSDIVPERLVLLSGSATSDLLESLSQTGYETSNIRIFDDLESCVKHSLEKTKNQGKIVFSPGSASFEKFNNEFHRGEVFNQIISSLLD